MADPELVGFVIHKMLSETARHHFQTASAFIRCGLSARLGG
ncbi:hypothetical protein Y013_25350 (plasmid) [Rhodococcus pyridinivorans SB3094]|uniref:Uncharacterized protein n=1 Tax=Rhodococcus pyridinivorans SB3094 TaxID=1435356 RepID=V9XPH6_9NOCA|nr:hypothetical protein Y013_25350 [Rhodococcus pyridinivorans SB3094]